MYTGQQFGNYRLLHRLGEGGFAQVYLGEHIHLQTQAAVKILTVKLTDEEIALFRNEARLLMNMDHPHIIRILDFGIQGSVPFLVMTYAPHGSLRKIHPKGTCLPLPQIISYMSQIASALQYIHERKLIHCDIKPENMLVGQDGTIVLSDFGIATVAHSERSLVTQKNIVGTAVYMAPELFQGKPQTASDQYALGIIVYEWITGIPPFRGSLAQLAFMHAHTSPQSFWKQCAVSPEIEAVVLKAIAKDPSERFSTVQAFASALEEASCISATTSPQKKILLPEARSSSVFIGPESKTHLISSPIFTPSGGRQREVPSSRFVEGDLRSSTVKAFSSSLMRRAWPWQRLLPIVLMIGVLFSLYDVVLPWGTALMQNVSQQREANIAQNLSQTSEINATDEQASVVETFLKEVMQKDYDRALDHFDSSLQILMTPMDLERQSQAADRCYGPIIHYAKISQSESAQSVSYAYMITRGKLSQPYTLHFVLQRDAMREVWLISRYFPKEPNSQDAKNDLGPEPTICEK